MIQKQLAVPQKSKWGAKEFPFRRFLTCASCGSQIVGEEKFKARTDTYTTTARGQVDYNCVEPYVREEAIITELLRVFETTRIRLDDCEPGLVKAMKRFGLMVQTSQPQGAYVRYVLERGTDFEKTRLIRNMTVNLTVHNRKLHAVPQGSRSSKS